MSCRKRVVLALGVIAVSAAITLSACGSTSHQIVNTGAAAGSGPFLTAATMPQNLAGRAVQPFSLTYARGNSTRLAGRPYVLTFLYVHCVDVCPLIGSEIRDALAKLGVSAPRINVVAVSVDPRGDTRSAVNRWLTAHHEPMNFHHLIGLRQLAPVWKAFYVSPQTPNNPHSTHTAVIWLINRHGHPVALVPAALPIDTGNLANDLLTLINLT